ncbi:hypothetical protein ACRAWF_17165 [Streptomyces sp. L7]
MIPQSNSRRPISASGESGRSPAPGRGCLRLPVSVIVVVVRRTAVRRTTRALPVPELETGVARDLQKGAFVRSSVRAPA